MEHVQAWFDMYVFHLRYDYGPGRYMHSSRLSCSGLWNGFYLWSWMASLFDFDFNPLKRAALYKKKRCVSAQVKIMINRIIVTTIDKIIAE